MSTSTTRNIENISFRFLSSIFEVIQFYLEGLVLLITTFISLFMDTGVILLHSYS